MAMILTQKVELKIVTSFDIKVNRWTDSHGNTYHSCYVSALIGDRWEDLGHETFTYGYGTQGEYTGLEIIKETVIGFNPKEKVIHQIEKEINKEITVRYYDVKRKKDM
ncbi:hypothetical protein FOI42_RS03100 [Escherichia coli]|nr:hypothetical protein [Escherichia coli]